MRFFTTAALELFKKRNCTNYDPDAPFEFGDYPPMQKQPLEGVQKMRVIPTPRRLKSSG